MMGNKIRIIKTYVKTTAESVENLAMIREFDNNGNMIFVKEYDEEGLVIFETKSEFDSDSKILSEEVLDGENKTYTYNDDGQLVLEKIEYDGGWFSFRKYEQDLEKKIVKVTCCDEDDELEEYSETEYNDNGDLLCLKEFDEENKLKSMQVNSYREDGLLLLKEEYTTSKKPDKIHHYYYNDDGRITAVQTLNSSGRQLDWVKIIYDENGKPAEQLTMSGTRITLDYDKETKTVTEVSYDGSGEMTSKVITTRDDAGNILTEESSGRVSRYVYEYF